MGLCREKSSGREGLERLRLRIREVSGWSDLREEHGSEGGRISIRCESLRRSLGRAREWSDGCSIGGEVYVRGRRER